MVKIRGDIKYFPDNEFFFMENALKFTKNDVHKLICFLKNKHLILRDLGPNLPAFFFMVTILNDATKTWGRCDQKWRFSNKETAFAV